MIRSALCLAVLLLQVVGHDSRGADVVAPGEADWPSWRGPHQNNTSTETDLVDRWDPRGGPDSNLLWKSTELAGRSTPIVMRGRLFMIVRDARDTALAGAKVVCIDAATGEKIWEHRFNIYLSDVPNMRVAWSSCAGDPATGRVYALSVCGYFCCLEGATGEVVWQRSLHEEFGLLSTYGGRTHSPIVFEDLVLAGAIYIGWGDAPEWGFLAKPAHRFLALDKASGEVRWLSGTGISPYGTTYSTPTLTTFDGTAAMVFGSGDGNIWALQPRTGKRIWSFPFSRQGVNTSPLVVGDAVYASHSEENVEGNTMGSVVALDGTLTGDLTDKEKWRAFEVMAGKASPLMVDRRLWLVDDRAKLHIFDPATGERIARKALGSVMRGTPLYADGKVYCCTHQGRWYVLQPTANGVEILHKLRLKGESSDGSPIVSQGRIYLPTSAALYCIGRKKGERVAGLGQSQPSAAAPTRDTRPAHLQLVPYDALLAPGDQQAYRARLYNGSGDFLRELPADQVEYSVQGVGQISPDDGIYRAPEGSEHHAARIVAQAGSVRGTARVRVVPALPWSFNFDRAKKVPLTWVGGRVRYVIRNVGGEMVAVKRSVLPTPRDPKNKLGTRSRLWMGPIHLSDYTIQADFALQRSDETGKMPDLGLINSRYTMTVRSSNNQLRLYSWSAHERRTIATTHFDPEPGAWYTMKLQVVPRDKTAVVRGKLWPRSDAEPVAWSAEFVDERPNLTGSPGLYGNAQEAEIFVDNITVVPNP